MNDTCTINVHAVSGSLIPNASMMKLRVEIDGTVHEARWGDSTYTVTPGTHEIKIYYWHPLSKNSMIRSATIDVEPSAPCTLRYSLQWTSSSWGGATLEVNGQPDPEGGASRSDSQLQYRWLISAIILPFIALWLLGQVDWPLWFELTLMAVSISFLIYVVVNKRRSQPDHSG